MPLMSGLVLLVWCLLPAIPPQNTGRTCLCCGHVSKNNRQTQAKFLCGDCGYENNADVVGAINVLERGGCQKLRQLELSEIASLDQISADA